jgi:hypothetical protein
MYMVVTSQDNLIITDSHLRTPNVHKWWAQWYFTRLRLESKCLITHITEIWTPPTVYALISLKALLHTTQIYWWRQECILLSPVRLQCWLNALLHTSQQLCAHYYIFPEYLPFPAQLCICTKPLSNAVSWAVAEGRALDTHSAEVQNLPLVQSFMELPKEC